MTYCDNEWFTITKFDHDAVVINSFGEVLDGTPTSAYNSRRQAALIQEMRNRIMAAEDAEIFKILDSIAQSGNNDI